MKKLIVVSVIMAVMFLTWGSVAPACAQDSTKDDKPTFYHLVPGTYVNGWPRFTMTYPKDWVERPPMGAGSVFRAYASAPYPSPHLSVVVVPSIPLDRLAEAFLPPMKAMGFTDVTVVSDRPSRLRDGTPAREIDVRGVQNGGPIDLVYLATNKGGVLIHVSLISYGGKVGDDQKAILYSLQFEPDKDKPMKVPPDVQEFLDKHSNDIVSHDLAKVMTHYSDRYLNSGEKKGEVERFWRWMIGSVTSINGTVTDFVPAGDKAYLAGFVTGNFGIGTTRETSIIKENGEWKWYGNQREVVP
jgi:hypothetical protein